MYKWDGKSILASNPHLYKKKGAAPITFLYLDPFFSSSIVVHMYVHSTIFEGTNGSRNVVCFRLSRPYDFRSPRKLNVNSSPCHDFCSEGKKFEAQIEANIGRELEKKNFYPKGLKIG